jgi:hypothetical protein
MASSQENDEENSPKLRLTSPTFEPKPTESRDPEPEHEGRRPRHLHRRNSSDHGEQGFHRHIRLQEPNRHPGTSSSSIYLGSFGHHSRRSRSSVRDSLRSPSNSVPPSPRTSINYTQLQHLLQDLNTDLETYGLEELRDGFFDASFFKPAKENPDALLRMAEYSLPAAFKKSHPLSVSDFFPKQLRGMKAVARQVFTTRAGIKLSKSFLGFFIAYILCLIPVCRDWLGRYNYIITLSAIINHAGRPVGAQIDGTIMTILGCASGLGWGAFALWLSDSTKTAQTGYGGILAAFLVLFMGTISALRSYFIRLYQMVLCAGIAITYMCLANTSEKVDWGKMFDFGIPWLLGQAICLIVCVSIFPDAGARPLAVALHGALDTMKEGLNLPRPDNVAMHRRLAWNFVNLSQAHRDLVLDLSVTRFSPADVKALRNLMQGVIRSLIAMKTETKLFEIYERDETSMNVPQRSDDTIVNIDGRPRARPRAMTDTEERALRLVARKLADPTNDLLNCMRTGLERCDAVLMGMSGYRRYLGPPEDVSSDILGALTSIRKAMIKFDDEDESLIDNPLLPSTYSDRPELVELFLFVHPIRQAATSIEELLRKVNQMQQKRRGWTLYLPSYQWRKALQRTNGQVRHDRGGVTAGHFFNSQRKLQKTMQEMQATTYKPTPRGPAAFSIDQPTVSAATQYGEDDSDLDFEIGGGEASKKRLRYRIWLVLHRLQGFETRFALKVSVVTSLLSIPAWLPSSRDWWNKYEIWWAVVMVWIMMVSSKPS